MLKLSDIDTSKCLFDPKKSDLLTIAKDIPPFDRELSYRVSKKMIITWIVLLYDQNSSLRKEIRSFPLRKGTAMILAGAKTDKEGRFERPVELILEAKNQDVNAMIVKYISLQNNPKYGQLIAYQTMYHLELAKIQNGAYIKSNEIIKAIDTLASSIDKLTEEIVGGKGEAESILSAIYKEVTKDISISPESISNYLADGGDLPDDWCEYNEWKENEKKSEVEYYKVNKIKFIGAE
jgi:hypothetical protein